MSTILWHEPETDQWTLRDVTNIEPVSPMAVDIMTELLAENAKLRKLLSAAYRCTNAGPSCLECRIVAGGCTLLSAMRELGIEAGE